MPRAICRKSYRAIVAMRKVGKLRLRALVRILRDITKAVGFGAHAEGQNTTARADGSHAEGERTLAIGGNSHAEGKGTTARGENQHVQGSYNVDDTDGKYLHIVGNGTADNARSNAHTLDKQGNAWFAGDVEGDGFIVASPDGTRWKLTVNNSGALTVARA